VSVERPPEVAVVQKWKFQEVRALDDRLEAHDWIAAFGSAALVATIEQCMRSSLTVAQADARLAEARAAMDDARSRLSPQVTLNGSGANSGVVSRRGATGSGALYSWTLSGAWDLDVWGGNRASLRAAAYSVDASRYAAIDARLDLISAITSTFVQLSALRERQSIANRNLASALNTQARVASRVGSGYAPKLDLVQQQALVATQKVGIASLEQQIGDSEIALARLLDVPPSSMDIEIDSFERLSIPAVGPALPAQLLSRRPDVAQSEALLLAADADLEAARAAVLPGFSLGASLGNLGADLARWVTAPVYTVAASVAATVFDGGHLRAQRALAFARQQELLAGYRRVVVGAYAGVESALNAAKQSTAQASLQDEVVRQERQVLMLAQVRYRAGGGTFLDVLDAQRSLFAQEDLAVQLRLSQLLAAVALFKSLGGGWRAHAPSFTADDATRSD
jgi:NodT family efflux transporter outer membrane factor (OMF) lipoprotein